MRERRGLTIAVLVRGTPPDLDTVLRQRVDEAEIIVVVDAASEASLEHVARAAAADGRVRLVRAGERSLRSSAIDAARGAFIAFHDSDDVPAGAYQALVESLIRTGSDVALFGGETRSGTSVRADPTLIARRGCGLAVFDTSFLRAAPRPPREEDDLPGTTRVLLAADRIDVVGGQHRCRARRLALVDYLVAERACATLVGDRRAPALALAYGGFVREHEAFARVAHFAEDGVDDDDVRAALRALLDVLPAGPAHADPLRALVIDLVARGRTAAARPLARWLRGGADDPAAQVRDWVWALTSMADAELLWPHVRVALVPAVAAALRAGVPVDDARGWRALVEEARRVLAPDALVLVPEASTHPALAARALAARALVAGRVRRVVRNGRVVEVEGRSAVGGDRAMPILHAGAGADDVAAAAVDWVPAPDGGWRWTARYPLRSLPLERMLAPALSVSLEGFAVAVDGADGELPPVRNRDALLCDRVAGAVVLRRRSHWLLRAVHRRIDAARTRAASARRVITDQWDRLLVR
ncbi:glycosyltransferase [Microbacterium sp. NPDC055683]